MSENTLKKYSVQVLLSVLFTLAVIPGFGLIGNLFLQVVVTIFVSLIIILISDFKLKTNPASVANSLIAMVVFWTSFSLVKQIEMHIATNNNTLRWLFLFYYDKPALIFIVLFVCALYYIVKLIVNKKDDFINEYKWFIRKITTLFLVYYSIILVYSFFLVREITFVRPEYNLKPFSVIESTFTRGYWDYELIFLFLGNIAIFLPLGIFISALTKNKFILILLPIVLSSGIEFSQYFLGNGHPDIDDVILNISGFYFGLGIKQLLDFCVFKFTKGKFSSFFIFN